MGTVGTKEFHAHCAAHVFLPLMPMSILAHLRRFAFVSFALAAWSGPALAESSPVPRVAQDDELPDKREEVATLIDQLKEHAGKRGKEDDDAVAVIDKLVGEFPKSGPKDRGAIVKAIGTTFKQKRQENSEGVRQNQLFMASAISLGLMAPESVKVLQKWIGDKAHRKDLGLQRVLILSLGKSQDPKAAKTLIDLLVHKHPIVQGAAAEALGYYEGSDQKLRKKAFEGILKVLTGVKTQVDTDLNDTIARERYDVIAAPMDTALGLLSGEESRRPQEWRKFWNKNKKRNWDEGS